MIITKIKLHPFGNLNDTELVFQAGLNVILGPNEAGKSTVFNAIQKILLTPTVLNKKTKEKELLRHMPIGGGDTISLDLFFEYNGASYSLAKTWGATRAAQLRLPDGVIITDDDAVRKRLESCLPAKSGTVKSVLMTYQSGLEKTLEDLRNDLETVHTLGDMLRKAVLETDGISVEKFKAKLQKLHDEYLSRWDLQKQYPEGGKGIEDPWKKGIGLALNAFYEKEGLRVKFKDALNYESQLDALNRAMEALSRSIAERNAFHQENWQIVDDVKRRRTVESEARLIASSIQEYKRINNDWPVYEKEIEKIDGKIPKIQEKEQTLLIEKTAALKEEQAKMLREKYSRIKAKKDLLDETDKKLNLVKKISKEELDEIKAAAARVDHLHTSIEASKLRALFKPNKDIMLTIVTGVDSPIRSKMTGGQLYEIKASGRLKLGHEDWQMAVTSGDDNFEKMKSDYDQASAEITSLLKRHEVETLEQAIKINGEYEARLADAINDRKNYKNELQGESYEELEEKIKQIGEKSETRPISIVVEELVHAQNEITNMLKDRLAFQKKLDEFVAKYKSKDGLIEFLVDAKKKEQEIQADIAGMKPLPEEVTDIDAYLRKFDENWTTLLEDQERSKNHQIEQAGLLERAPEESSEELGARLRENERNFESVLKKAEAVEKIRTLADQILANIDIGMYQELEKDLEHSAAVITQNRYEAVKMEKCMPVGFVRKDGNVVLYDLLSHGTKDMLGLGLRLAIAKHFLKDADGFLAMDDPLVNMDPERQERAAEIIRKFGEHKQVIVFTCHPSHAKLMYGNQIDLQKNMNT